MEFTEVYICIYKTLLLVCLYMAPCTSRRQWSFTSFLSYFSNFHTYWCSLLIIKYICVPFLCRTYVDLFLAQWNFSNLRSKWKRKYQYASYRVFVTVVQNLNMLINFNKNSPSSDLIEIHSKVLKLPIVGTSVDRETNVQN